MQVATMVSASDDRQYEQLLRQLTVADGPLFTTDVIGLFDTFLDYLPSEYRQHYTCNSCRQFVDRFGGLVTIDEFGNADPAIWDVMDKIPPLFGNSIIAMRGMIASAKVTGVFYSDKSTWGTPVTGKWRHMHIVPPSLMVYRSRLQTPFQAMAEKAEDYGVLGRSLGDYSRSTVETALTILQSDSLYRVQKVIGVAEWLHGLMSSLEKTKHQQRRHNLMWRAVATAPAGFCHARNTMIGTLLDDIASGMDFDAVKRRFDAKMHPLQYQRPQAAPSAGNIEQAEKIVEKLGIANSLRRRFARIEDVVALWVPKRIAKPTNGVFGHLTTKDKPATNTMELPSQTVTWAKFERDVLPKAESIQFYINGQDHFTALLTAADMDAPPILQWDNTEQRNPVSWYLYNNGSSPDRWGLPRGWVDVTAVTLQPCMWYGNYSHQSKGVVFLLKGAVDKQSSGNGLFPEILKSELREIRSTIEAYSRNATVEDRAEASACGVILQDTNRQRWNGRFRVIVGNTVQQYTIDRWE